MSNVARNAGRTLKVRRADFDSQKDTDGFKRPGSLNAHKSGAPKGRSLRVKANRQNASRAAVAAAEAAR